jgi:homopolymeric O-antigen transport system permease protein
MMPTMSHTQSREHVPKRGFWGFVRYLYHLTDHRIRQQTKSYALGFLWWIIDPIVNTAILYVVTTTILGVRTPGHAFFLLTGLMMYRFLQSAINSSCVSLTPVLALSARLYLPKYIFVLRDFAAQMTQFLIGVAFLIFMLSLFGDPSNIKVGQLIIVIAVAATFALASCSVTALVSLVISDFRVILGYVFRALFFLSGTFFTLDRVPEEWRTVFLANPFALLIHEMRVALMLPDSLDIIFLAVLLGASVVMGTIGFLLLLKFDRILPKYVR